MKTAYIVLNGNLSKGISGFKPSKKDLVICADGGAVFARKQNIIPHIIIGDCDSIPNETKEYFEKKCVAFLKYPREKDFTDSELAVEYALKNGAQKLVIYGLFGDRIDHMISNIYHLSTIVSKTSCIFIEGNTNMHFIHSSIELTGRKGDELSLIPLKGRVKGVTTWGLYYPLKNEDLIFGTTRGISNVFENKQVKVSIKTGLLLAIYSKKSI
jgi:thiamine pyrophosphokinase